MDRSSIFHWPIFQIVQILMSSRILGDLFTPAKIITGAQIISTSTSKNWHKFPTSPMPVQTTAVPKQVEEAKKTNLKPNVNLPQTQTPPPAVRKKSAKSERASLLCSTPPTCIKDKDSHVEYTRREFLGEVFLLVDREI